MDVSLWDYKRPTRALRNLALGRILLQSDYTDGTTVKVGSEFSDGRPDIPGINLFKSDLISKPSTISAILVQPETSPGAADGWQESVTVEYPEDEPTHLTISAPATYDYTVAGGAYIQPVSLPSLISSLELVVQDYEFVDDMTVLKLPALLVRLVDSAQSHAGSIEWTFEFVWECKFYRQRVESEGPDAFYDDYATLLNWMNEDPRLGGTVYQALPRRARRITDAAKLPFDFGVFEVWASVKRVDHKFPG